MSDKGSKRATTLSIWKCTLRFNQYLTFRILAYTLHTGNTGIPILKPCHISFTSMWVAYQFIRKHSFFPLPIWQLLLNVLTWWKERIRYTCTFLVSSVFYAHLSIHRQLEMFYLRKILFLLKFIEQIFFLPDL